MKNLPISFKHYFLLLCFLLSTLFAPMVYSQDQQPIFHIVENMKVKPGMTSEYLDAETKVWKKIHQERIKAGNIVGWALYEVRYPSGTDAAYDYVTVTTVSGWDGIEKFYQGWDALFAKLSKEDQAVTDKTEQLRDLTMHQVVYQADGIFKEDFATKPPKYLVVNYMSVPEGRWQEYQDMETKLVKPMHAEQMKSGKGRAAWGFYSQVAPFGEEQPYDAYTVDFFNTWQDMNADGGNFQETLQKVHPGMSPVYYNRKIEESRKLMKGEVWVLVDGL